ncbi:putative DNA repair protein [Aspergillus tanneri]|uniref:Metallo-beta-lactamase domain-containing protein n=1 Tax=Aspergillus tanneri TaxID=1220188 RepID=A0A5M9MN90_9EURO|nr:uncharacterized protein ATNIH1004_004386 [Aspergillus tanneri]KAA8648501.1 hypothetical protein ATNIH1004_004386 [Aspergillus tanneri]
MSTFDGIIQEFPYIQIDYFRKSPDRPPPLACFLSHVHSDHLQGLESFRAPFIYCSAATRELLLHIEKYPHRMNFSKGILESRRLHYKHLSKLLRPIPLDTPTEIELTPRLSIRVTLLNANHCTGAVMFLIEGNGKAILYTGDIRGAYLLEKFSQLVVSFSLTKKQLSLDMLYLDNTFARPSYVRHTFPSKAEGLAELLQKVALYPKDTIFYFRAWTFGYEEVWVALSAVLNSKIHLDRYQIGLYRSLVSCSRVDANEASALCGYELGNRFVSGCLSEDEQSRIHSCEPGVTCSAISSSKLVYIIPIVHRAKDGSKVPELGIGGGGGDLYQIHELEIPDESTLEQLDKLCLEQIHDSQVLSQTRKTLVEAFRSKSKTLSLDNYRAKNVQNISLESLIHILSRGHSKENLGLDAMQRLSATNDKQGHTLPNTIHFPYSRHSSYLELLDMGVSMQQLFGHLCSG